MAEQQHERRDLYGSDWYDNAVTTAMGCNTGTDGGWYGRQWYNAGTDGNWYDDWYGEDWYDCRYGDWYGGWYDNTDTGTTTAERSARAAHTAVAAKLVEMAARLEDVEEALQLLMQVTPQPTATPTPPPTPTKSAAICVLQPPTPPQPQTSTAICVRQPPPPPPPPPQLPPQPQHCCEWHGAGNAPTASLNSMACVETDFPPWLSHLDSTLGWYTKSQNFNSNFYNTLSQHWSDVEVVSCRTRANASFHVRCLQCSRGAIGSYGRYTSNEEKEDAVAAFHEFFLQEQLARRQV